MKQVAFIFIISLFIGTACQKEEHSYPLQGHWVQVEHLMNGYLNVMDITDSTTLYYRNKLSPPKEVPLHWNDSIYLPLYHLSYSPSWKLEKDQLTVYDNSGSVDSMVYTRVTDNRFWKEEYFSPLRVSVDLADWSADYEISREEITADRLYGDLFIGYPKDQEISKEVFLFVQDVFIGLDGIQQWISTERDMWSEENRTKLKVLIHADKDLPYTEIEKVLEILKQEKEPYTIYQAGISEELQDLVYRKID